MCFKNIAQFFGITKTSRQRAYEALGDRAAQAQQEAIAAQTKVISEASERLKEAKEAARVAADSEAARKLQERRSKKLLKRRGFTSTLAASLKDLGEPSLETRQLFGG